MVSKSRVGATYTRLLLNLAASAACLAAGEASGAQLTASWVDNSNGKATTRLERRLETDITFVALADIPPGVTEYADGSVTLGMAYCYRAMAYDAIGVSPYSEEGCAIAGYDGYVLSVRARKAGTGVGTVTSSPAGIHCGDACAAVYPTGTAVTLTATSAPGSKFIGWDGGCSGTGACTIAGNAAVTVTATFDDRFVDVSPADPFFTAIEALADQGITGGCSTDPAQFCPGSGVTRGEIAVLLLRAFHGAGYKPPVATGMFIDVPITHGFAAWIEQLALEGITSGCASNPLQYCPEDTVTRGQMAVFLLRAKYGATYDPPAPTGIFADVPILHPFAKWIEQLAREGITGGCGLSTYCLNAAVTRGQMALFIVRTFNLPT